MAQSRSTEGWDELEEEDRFQALSAAAFEGIILLQEGRVADANQRAAELLGYDEPGEMTGISPEDLAVAEERERLAEMLHEQDASRSEVTLKRKDGGTFLAEVQSRAFSFKGTFARVVAVRDITRGAAAQEALRVSEERYRKLTETAADAIITTDELGVILDWNAAAERIFGYPRDQAVGLPVTSLMPQRYVDAHVHGMERVNNTGETHVIGHTVEVHGLRRGGEEFPLELSLSMWYAGGRVRYTGIIRDITSRKVAAEALQRQTRYVQLLQNVAVAANEATSVQSAMQFAVDEICGFAGWPVGHVYLSSEQDGHTVLTPSAIWHTADRPGVDVFREATELTALEPGSGLPGRVYATGRPAWIVDVRRDPNFPRAKLARDIGVKTGFAFPVLLGKEVAAVLEFFSDQAVSPDEALVEAMSHIGGQLGRVIERRRAQDAVQESEARYRLLAEYATDLITRHTPAGDALYVSPASKRLLGYEPDELIGQNMFTFFHPADVERVQERYRLMLEQPEPQAASYRIRRKDGSYTWFESTSQAVREKDNGAVREFVAVSRDITERKEAEEALRVSEELLSSVLQSSVDAVSAFKAVRDAAGNIIDFEWLLANPKAVALSATGRETLVGSRVRRDAPGSPDAAFFEAYKQVVESGAFDEVTMPFQPEGADGEQPPLWLHMTAVKLSEGCAATIHDVTERMQARQSIERANEALANSNRELQEFAYVASHDLQEPLRKISSFADILQMEYGERLDETGIHYLERMQNAAMRMSRLISDLLAFSRVSTQGRPFETVDLNEVLDGVLSDLELLIEDSGAEVRSDVLPVVEADRTQMRQLLQNLISNGIKFRAADRPSVVQVRSTATQQDEDHPGLAFVTLTVRDNGIGFDQKYADRIFVPFQRLHSGTEYPGTGIGLAVCRRIAERHGGNISVQSTPGEGTEFTVRLLADQTPD